MREGIIVSTARIDEFGCIRDENFQEIQFKIELYNEELKVGSHVGFEIEMTSHGLMAVEITSRYS
ncbi:hypothetical protein ACFOG5_02540 [Pedobacter fastidiosus]|uniref:Uncharacterized protein n=1 Tax=Pedobacter fastidiosus TaxID=2765361 RepID=A0ABR7KYG1_9SPHI|nr:hypothetical protein [Pedobacter fastidiosus]MBC6113163.1 hypothetical protein [Pedobacter fastidiosus]